MFMADSIIKANRSDRYIGNAYGLNWNINTRGNVYQIQISGTTDQALQKGVAYRCFPRIEIEHTALLAENYINLIEFNSQAILCIWYDSSYLYMSINTDFPASTSFSVKATFVA